MNYLHKKFKTYEEGLKAFIEWRRGMFPHDWTKEDKEYAEQDFQHYWNEENLEKILW